LLAQICARVAIEAPRDAGYDALGLPLLHAPPEHAGKGPLAGLTAGLGGSKPEWRVVFAPCDMPLLTRAVYEELARACEHAPGAYAVSPAGEEPLVAILGGGLRAALLEALARDELPRTHVVLDAAGAKMVEFADEGPFANVNAPADLERLERLR
jgi:molybdopterin-guanine dinucleotide biosynthesis protein A